MVKEPEPTRGHIPAVKHAKTFKRELAIALLIILGVVGYLALSDEQAMLIFDMLRWPIFTLVSGAFGLDAISKQWSAR